MEDLILRETTIRINSQTFKYLDNKKLKWHSQLCCVLGIILSVRVNFEVNWWPKHDSFDFTVYLLDFKYFGNMWIKQLMNLWMLFNDLFVFCAIYFYAIDSDLIPELNKIL